ncbi:MAG TPA: hypothetical protein VNO34_01890 [Actinomycetota bacterium]|nr:hypothetical protein [Actinomycetota bacterium]
MERKTKKISPKAPGEKAGTGKRRAATRVTKQVKAVQAVQQVQNVQNVQ